jgi:hypothetical protein
MSFVVTLVAPLYYILLLVSMVLSRGVPGCKSDEDCVPSSCCHAETCVLRQSQSEPLNCSVTLCYAQCRPMTIDCGGFCFCEKGNCSVYFRSGVAPAVAPKPPPEPPKSYQLVKFRRVISIPRGSKPQRDKDGRPIVNGRPVAGRPISRGQPVGPKSPRKN